MGRKAFTNKISAVEHEIIRQQENIEKVTKALESKAINKARFDSCMASLNNGSHCGRFGDVAEILSSNKNSRKTSVAKANENDDYLRWININGKVVNRPFEKKTNGGRIEKMINLLDKGIDTIISYELDVCNKNTSGQRRQLNAIMYFSQFYTLLLDCKATHSTNGKNPETAIQPTSKKMYEALLEADFESYEPNVIYTEVNGRIVRA